MSKEIIKLIGATKDYIWGGNKLRAYGKKSDSDRIAESWELSFHKDGESRTESGALLSDGVTAADLGEAVAKHRDFPVLVKLIDAADNLSVQVHPTDEYALKNEGGYGKTEAWYIMDADDGAGIYLGFKRAVTRDELIKAVSDGSVLDLLRFHKVKRGDSFLIPAGTVHAIGKGVTLCEAQENSNLTYRVYDYKRRDKFGNERPLHLSKALKVLDFSECGGEKEARFGRNGRIFIETESFSACISEILESGVIEVGARSFVSVTVTDGNGFIGDKEAFVGDTLFIPAGYGEVKCRGKMTLVVVEVI